MSNAYIYIYVYIIYIYIICVSVLVISYYLYITYLIYIYNNRNVTAVQSLIDSEVRALQQRVRSGGVTLNTKLKIDYMYLLSYLSPMCMENRDEVMKATISMIVESFDAPDDALIKMTVKAIITLYELNVKEIVHFAKGHEGEVCI
jgi:hypothetical protein